MTESLAQSLVEAAAKAEDDVMHDWCCDENVAWCGLDITDRQVTDDGTPCPLCELAFEDACPRCGE
jgi:hypothetical protein